MLIQKISQYILRFVNQYSLKNNKFNCQYSVCTYYILVCIINIQLAAQTDKFCSELDKALPKERDPIVDNILGCKTEAIVGDDLL